MMVANIMKNERRWGDLEARKSIVVDYKLGKVTKNNGNRCSAYVPEHHEAIVSPEIARAAHLVASSRKKCGVQDIVVIQQGTLKGFVGIHPNWSGINAESIRSLCLNAYLPEEVVELNDMTEMRSGKKSDMVLLSDYLTVSGTCFINQSSPVITISKNGIRFSKACHTRLDDCEYVELLYHPILQVVILRKSNHDFSTAMHWREDNDVHSAFSARAFSGLVFQTLNWRRNCRYQCIRLFEGIKYVLPILHPNKKRLALIMCPEEDSASVEWARRKDENWVNKDITSLEFVENIFRLMNWNRECRYKVLGRVANSDQGLCMLFDLEEAIMFTPKPQEYTDPLTGEMKKKQMKFFPDAYKNRIGKSYNDYIADHQMNMFEDFIGYQSSTVLDEPEREAGTTSIPIPQREESENIPLPDLSGQLENVQQSGNEIAKRGMPT